MKGIIAAIGYLMVFGVGFSPLLAQWLWEDSFMIIQSPWYIILIVVGIVLTIGSSLVGVFRPGIKNGEPAVGVITSVAQTGMYVNEQPQVRLGVNVAKGGEDPYPAQVTAVIPLTALAQIQEGKPVPLLVSPKNKQKVVLDLKGQVSKEQLQHLLNEQMVKRGVSPELMRVAQTGIKAFAKVMDATPTGQTDDGRARLRLTLDVTKADGGTFEVVTEKDVFCITAQQSAAGKYYSGVL
ncbi:hypothetical protein [Paenibacillus sp. DMB20]|uniref:hypothetical protein n=1 Tax=Paenibacillus sp. DMB20 TaxID=1642570 RepID=UPI000A50080B|nr:hypothetical protein [Paenibacillus sp. DMB20]